MKKFFANHLCFCCGIYGKEKSKKTPVPHKQPVALHDIVSNGNGAVNKNKEAHTNKSFQNDSDSVFVKMPLKDEKAGFRKPQQIRQTSDISEMFRLPLPDEKSLSELVIEEYDHKSKTLHARESGSLSDHRMLSCSSLPDLNGCDVFETNHEKDTSKSAKHEDCDDIIATMTQGNDENMKENIRVSEMNEEVADDEKNERCSSETPTGPNDVGKQEIQPQVSNTSQLVSEKQINEKIEL